MKHYKITYDYANDSDAICAVSNHIKRIDNFSTLLGNYIEDWDNKITLYFDPDEGDRETDYLGNDLGWLIISSRFKSLLEKIGVKNVQFLPITIENIKDGTKLHDYTIANICGLVDALDWSNSLYNEIVTGQGEKLIIFASHVLLGDRIEQHIFRLKDDPFVVFVSEGLKKLLKLNNIDGIDFYKVKTI